MSFDVICSLFSIISFAPKISPPHILLWLSIRIEEEKEHLSPPLLLFFVLYQFENWVDGKKREMCNERKEWQTTIGWGKLEKEGDVCDFLLYSFDTFHDENDYVTDGCPLFSSLWMLQMMPWNLRFENEDFNAVYFSGISLFLLMWECDTWGGENSWGYPVCESWGDDEDAVYSSPHDMISSLFFFTSVVLIVDFPWLKERKENFSTSPLVVCHDVM